MLNTYDVRKIYQHTDTITLAKMTKLGQIAHKVSKNLSKILHDVHTKARTRTCQKHMTYVNRYVRKTTRKNIAFAHAFSSVFA